MPDMAYMFLAKCSSTGGQRVSCDGAGEIKWQRKRRRLNALSCSPSLSSEMRELDVDNDATKTMASNSPMAAAAADILRRRELPEVEEGSSGVASAMGALDFLHEWISHAGSFAEEAQWQRNAALMLPTLQAAARRPRHPCCSINAPALVAAANAGKATSAPLFVFGVAWWCEKSV